MHGILICSFILFGSYFTITWIDNRYIFRKPKSLIDSRLLYAKLKIDRSTDQVSALVAISTYLQPAPLRAPQPGHWGGHTAHSRHMHADTRGPTAASLCEHWQVYLLLRESETRCVQTVQRILQWLQCLMYCLVLISWSCNMLQCCIVPDRWKLHFAIYYLNIYRGNVTTRHGVLSSAKLVIKITAENKIFLDVDLCLRCDHVIN